MIVCELIRELSDASLNQYNSNGVFTPSVLRKGLFTIIPKDNFDHDGTSSTNAKHTHVTGMTAIQFRLCETEGVKIDFLHETDFTKCPSKLKNQKMPESYVQVMPIYHTSQSLFAPLQTFDVTSYDET